MKEKKVKVLCVFGTRPEVIKMAPVVEELKRHPKKFEVVVCTTAQHRQIVDQMLEIFDLVPDVDLDLMRHNQSLDELSSRVLMGITKILLHETPDCVLIQGDTTTVLMVALACFYQQIPVGHIEAGLRTNYRYNPFPEEMNRRLTSVLSTYHFAPTQTAVQALMQEGVQKSFIWCTGNTVIDALHKILVKPYNIKLGVELKENRRLILVTVHRRENFGKPLEEIMLALRYLVEQNPDVEIIYPVHPNPEVQEPAFRLLKGVDRIYLLEPLDYLLFVHLMKNSYLILTDSGGIQEEAPALGKPVLVLRNETERPEAVEAGSVRVIGTDTETIISETENLLHDISAYNLMVDKISPYGDGNAAKRIVTILTDKYGLKISGKKRGKTK